MKPVLLVGNDINNVTNNISWQGLLKEIIDAANVQIDVGNMLKKPFPLLYEEIYLNSIRSSDLPEIELKRRIGKIVDQIKPNSIHSRIAESTIDNVLTTNYEHSLERSIKSRAKRLRNLGIIKEAKYSIFRHHELGNKFIWHIHGDMYAPNSILLGYEQYSGQLQQMRNYLITGSNYKSGDVPKRPLINRLGQGDYQLLSWIDFFFSRDIHILGLKLDFTESDLWWLFTIRSRRIFEKQLRRGKFEPFLYQAMNSSIHYYYPAEYHDQQRVELMQVNGMKTIAIDEANKEVYYHKVLDRINDAHESITI